MARITVEDCLKRIDNQFDLVMVAARRARRLANGAEPLVELENDKPTVVALREIAAGLITEEILDQMAEPEEDILSSEEAEELLASTPMPGLDPASATPTGFAPTIEITTEIKIEPKATPAPIAAETAPEFAAAAPEEAVAVPSDDLVADQLAALLAATPEPEAASAEDSQSVAEPEAAPAEDSLSAVEPEAVSVEDSQSAAEPEAAPAEDGLSAAEPEAAPAEDSQSAAEPEAAPAEDSQSAAEPEADDSAPKPL